MVHNDEFTARAARRAGRDLSSYDDLWRYSVEDLPGFWRTVWEHFSLDELTDTPLGDDDAAVLDDPVMPGARWFGQMRLNYVEAVLRHCDRDGAAIVGLDEDLNRTQIAWRELPGQVAAVATALRAAGIGPGDVVAAYLPDNPEAVVAFLATASLGAIWSGCGQDYAPEGAAGRLRQLNPKALFSCAGYRFNGKDVDKRGDSAELAALLDDPVLHVQIGNDVADGTTSWDRVLAGPAQPLEPVRVAADHPLWVLFSSGTTGVPKGIVHGHGGVLVEHLKQIGLHAGLDEDSVFFWHTALSWMMWNFQVAGLLVGSRIVTYSGSPLYPDADRLWQIVADEQVTYFGTSPGQLNASRKARLVPGRDHDLSALATLGSTGSTLPADLFDWVEANVRAGLPISSISGGTDIVSAFAGGSAGLKVVAGELTVRHLGVALAAWSPAAQPLIGQVGELVVTAPMPSMPVAFWNDESGERYRSAYFDHEWERPLPTPVWRHGDWVTVTDRGSLIIHGRSDATLNRHGIRMGSADIYEVVEGIEDIAEAFVLGLDGPDGAYWMPMFVTLVPGAELTDELIERVRSAIRSRLSARHVPDEIIVAPGIPHTRTGKKLEVPITGILAGRSEVSIDPKAVDDPGLIEWYRDRGADHRW
ncbi:putative acetoacetyl-CoA synthetase [Gordonia hirsuta DSM 44140 = NBRC 16056]|uniref:Putative acetoacetyl-CoA synthetase n=1 Tax=Gordonia hirsuta DSM 44140 = NBRC 16056 TaxID=1121927 RepID=L7LBQ7_9ACTN|nr:acetoacetate--CoA ligase [Gordonia hirsuta]GAC57487.1 putative acetoacetyl-CoA synthetase [Gordonia hirsuta DSM 44140 = NBRC 16056]